MVDRSGGGVCWRGRPPRSLSASAVKQAMANNTCMFQIKTKAVLSYCVPIDTSYQVGGGVKARLPACLPAHREDQPAFWRLRGMIVQARSRREQGAPEAGPSHRVLRGSTTHPSAHVLRVAVVVGGWCLQDDFQATYGGSFNGTMSGNPSNYLTQLVTDFITARSIILGFGLGVAAVRPPPSAPAGPSAWQQQRLTGAVVMVCAGHGLHLPAAPPAARLPLPPRTSRHAAATPPTPAPAPLTPSCLMAAMCRCGASCSPCWAASPGWASSPSTPVSEEKRAGCCHHRECKGPWCTRPPC